MNEANNPNPDSAVGAGAVAAVNTQAPVGAPESTRERLQMVAAGLLFSAIGAAWIYAFRRWAPNWSIDEVFNHGSGIPIWTLGMFWLMFGVPLVVTAPLPRVRDWLSRHMGFNMIAAIAVVLLWLIGCVWAGFIK